MLNNIKTEFFSFEKNSKNLKAMIKEQDVYLRKQIKDKMKKK